LRGSRAGGVGCEVGDVDVGFGVVEWTVRRSMCLGLGEWGVEPVGGERVMKDMRMFQDVRIEQVKKVRQRLQRMRTRPAAK